MSAFEVTGRARASSAPRAGIALEQPCSPGTPTYLDPVKSISAFVQDGTLSRSHSYTERPLSCIRDATSAALKNIGGQVPSGPSLLTSSNTLVSNRIEDAHTPGDEDHVDSAQALAFTGGAFAVGEHVPTVSAKPQEADLVSRAVLNASKKQMEDCFAELNKKVIFRVDPSLMFIPAGTPKAVLSRKRLTDLFKAILKAHPTSDPADEMTTRKRIDRLIAIVTDRNLHDILAILIYSGLGETEILSLLEEPSDPLTGKDGLSDDCLPIDSETAVRHFGTRGGELFYRHQFLFKPFVFQEGEENSNIAPFGQPLRLPLVTERIKIGEGAHGDVYKVTFAKGGWRYKDGSTNAGEKTVAQKVTRADFRDEDQKFFLDERRVLFQIGQNPTKHKNLTPCLGSLEASTQHTATERSLFFDLARANLEQVLIDKSAPRVSPAAILRLAADMCSGMHHLHQGLVDNGERVYGFHLDFRPQNVLIFDIPINGKMVEEWRLADFGLSRIKGLRPGSDHSPDWTRNRRFDGTFLAPEATSTGKVNYLSDLWSLAAVLLEIITFAIGGPDLVLEFRKARMTEKGTDAFWVEGWRRAQVNKKVSLWCERLRKDASEEDEELGTAIDRILSYLQNAVLVIDIERRKRTSADKISNLLSSVSKQLEGAEKLRHTTRLSLDKPDTAERPYALRNQDLELVQGFLIEKKASREVNDAFERVIEGCVTRQALEPVTNHRKKLGIRNTISTYADVLKGYLKIPRTPLQSEIS